MENKEDLSCEYLKSILNYDKDTGIFTWRSDNRKNNSWNARYVGKVAGSKRRERMTHYLYFALKIDGKIYYYYGHRLAWLYTYGFFPKNKIGHDDGNGLNNAIDNLFDITISENNKNVKLRKENTSGFCGVYYHKASGKWNAKIQVNGKYINGGYFINKKDAITRRKELNKEYKFHANHGL